MTVDDLRKVVENVPGDYLVVVYDPAADYSSYADIKEVKAGHEKAGEYVFDSSNYPVFSNRQNIDQEACAKLIVNELKPCLRIEVGYGYWLDDE